MCTSVGNDPGEGWVAVCPRSGCARGNSVQSLMAHNADNELFCEQHSQNPINR